MNKIIVTNDSIRGTGIIVDDNSITFEVNGEYAIFYENLTSANLKIIVADDVVVKIFEYSNNEKIKIVNNYVLGMRSNLLLFKFYDNDFCECDNIIDLNGKYSKVSYHFSSISNNIEKYRIVINHNNSYTWSDIINRNIAVGGEIDFTIDSYVSKGNIKCVLNQETKIINIFDNKSVIRPNMYISENDVEARHGSVIGRFRDEEVFYLMSRGISYDDALKLLVKGYILSNLIIDDEYKEFVLKIINKYWR